MKRYIAFLSIVLFFTSCAMEEAFEPVVPEVETELPDSVFFILADPAPLTRVTYAGDGLHSDFEKEDLVGCFALNDDLTAAEGDGFKPNACYRVSVHTNITTGEDRRFLSPVTASDDLDKSKTKYLFYYPYDPEITSLDQLKEYTHSVNTDQNDRDRYEASDLLWDICTPIAELKSVEVEMDHAMAQIIVEVESGLIKEGTVPTLLDIPTTVSKLDLVKSDLATMTADMDVEGSYELAEDSRKSITMWEFGYATSGNLMFRAAVPANHTISSGSKILSLENPDGNKVTYRLSKGLSFEPGKNYRLTLVSERQVVTPDVADEESWVLDVLDPETMQPVGLLCREYLRYQPTDNEDLKTGTDGHNSDGTATKYLNSQAWVFYDMDEDGFPNLNEGIVTRFIYDAIYNSYSKWPAPHNHTQAGYFTPSHGYDWDADTGTQKGPIQEYYMHGGKITWGEVEKQGTGRKQYKIVRFDMPTNQVTCDEAANMKIRIGSDGEPWVSYSDESSDKVAILQSHYLIDRRLNNVDYTVEVNKYPLTKIGYNQFWMSRSLNTSVFTDGKPLTCYNNASEDSPDVTFKSSEVIDEPGYMFPFAGPFTDKDGTSQVYNPYLKMEQRVADNGYIATRVYNKLAVNEETIISQSLDSHFYYKVPEINDMYNIEDYFAYIVGGMFMSSNIPVRTGAEEFDGNWIDILLRGQYLSSGKVGGVDAVANVYCANISGFNFHAIGYFEPGGHTYASPVGSAAMLIKSPDSGVNYYIINSWEAFTDSKAKLIINGYNYNNISNSFFAQIRFIMKYYNQMDTPSIVLNTVSDVSTKASSAPVESRDVYVGLEPVEAEL